MAQPTAHTFAYTVDGEPQTTVEHQLTARQILVNAGLNPETRYLIEIQGNHQVSYEGKLDEIIHIHEKQKFITAYIAQTPVS